MPKVDLDEAENFAAYHEETFPADRDVPRWLRDLIARVRELEAAVVPSGVTEDVVEVASSAYAEATEYYVPFHRGLSSDSADKIRKGVRAAVEAVDGLAAQPAPVVPSKISGQTINEALAIGSAEIRRLSAQAPAEAQGWRLVPQIGAWVSSSHPITCLNPDPAFQIAEVEHDIDKIYVRGEQTCWFHIDMISPASAPAQEPHP
jgi:hypothetical protein